MIGINLRVENFKDMSFLLDNGSIKREIESDKQLRREYFNKNNPIVMKIFDKDNNVIAFRNNIREGLKIVANNIPYLISNLSFSNTLVLNDGKEISLDTALKMLKNSTKSKNEKDLNELRFSQKKLWVKEIKNKNGFVIASRKTLNDLLTMVQYPI